MQSKMFARLRMKGRGPARVRSGLQRKVSCIPPRIQELRGYQSRQNSSLQGWAAGVLGSRFHDDFGIDRASGLRISRFNQVQILRTDRPPSESQNLQKIWIMEQIEVLSSKQPQGCWNIRFPIDTRADRAPPRLWTEVPRIQKTSGLQSSRRYEKSTFVEISGRIDRPPDPRIQKMCGLWSRHRFWAPGGPRAARIQAWHRWQSRQRRERALRRVANSGPPRRPSPAQALEPPYYTTPPPPSFLPSFPPPLALLALRLRPGLPQRCRGSIVLVAHLAQLNAFEYGKLPW